MLKFTKTSLFFFVVPIILVACNKPVKQIDLNVGVFSRDSICPINPLPYEIKSLFMPLQSSENGNLYAFSGKIFQFGLDPNKYFASISDTNANTISKWREKLLGGQDTYESVNKKYEQLLANVDGSLLCKTSGSDSTYDQKVKNIESLKGFQKTNIFVYSKILSDSSWNGYKVFKNIADIKKNILAAVVANSSGPYLVLLGVSDSTANNESIIVTTNPGSSGNDPYFPLEVLLAKISDVRQTDATRQSAVTEAMDKYFNPDFVVVMHDENALSNPRRWESKGEGKKYLERLTTEDAILGFKVLKLEKSLVDNKISRIELIEYHKTM
jgi:hypothetical protein